MEYILLCDQSRHFTQFGWVGGGGIDIKGLTNCSSIFSDQNSCIILIKHILLCSQGLSHISLRGRGV